jgi:hypothetical protein
LTSARASGSVGYSAGFRQHEAVVHEHRHLAVGVDFLQAPAILRVEQVDVDQVEVDAQMRGRQQYAARVG